jgi:hypothetical protein
VQLQLVHAKGQGVQEAQGAGVECLDGGEAVANCTAKLADELRVDVADGQRLAPVSKRGCRTAGRGSGRGSSRGGLIRCCLATEGDGYAGCEAERDDAAYTRTAGHSNAAADTWKCTSLLAAASAAAAAAFSQA